MASLTLTIPDGKVTRLLLCLGYSQEVIDSMTGIEKRETMKRVLIGYLISKVIDNDQRNLSVDSAAITQELNIS